MRRRYLTLERKETRARRNYRRNVDDAYTSVRKVREMLAKVPALEEAGAKLKGLPQILQTQAAKKAGSAIREAERAFRKVPGTYDLRSGLSKARADSRRGKSGKKRAEKRLNDVIALFNREVAWRSRAARELDPGLAAYEAAIRGTIGVRQLERLPTRLAKPVAACMSHHRDISLSF